MVFLHTFLLIHHLLSLTFLIDLIYRISIYDQSCFHVTSLLSPFFFEAAMQTVTRSLLYGISSYTLYYARQPQHDMNRPRIYCFKKNKDPFHEGKE